MLDSTSFVQHMVTTEVPPDKDLETWLEVGSWSWGWMEPPLGQLSFFLLCMQLARHQVCAFSAATAIALASSDLTPFF